MSVQGLLQSLNQKVTIWVTLFVYRTLKKYLFLTKNGFSVFTIVPPDGGRGRLLLKQNKKSPRQRPDFFIFTENM